MQKVVSVRISHSDLLVLILLLESQIKNGYYKGSKGLLKKLKAAYLEKVKK